MSEVSIIVYSEKKKVSHGKITRVVCPKTDSPGDSPTCQYSERKKKSEWEKKHVIRPKTDSPGQSDVSIFREKKHVRMKKKKTMCHSSENWQSGDRTVRRVNNSEKKKSEWKKITRVILSENWQSRDMQSDLPVVRIFLTRVANIEFCVNYNTPQDDENQNKQVKSKTSKHPLPVASHTHVCMMHSYCIQTHYSFVPWV